MVKRVAVHYSDAKLIGGRRGNSHAEELIVPYPFDPLHDVLVFEEGIGWRNTLILPAFQQVPPIVKTNALFVSPLVRTRPYSVKDVVVQSE